MADKVEVFSKGFDELGVKLNHKLRQAKKMGVESVVVGYEMPYALIQHENLDYRHNPGETAKYIEIPARRRGNRRAMAALVVKVLKQKKGMTQALLRAGKFLEKESQKIVPVDTGALHDSAFTEVVKTTRGVTKTTTKRTKTKLRKKIAKRKSGNRGRHDS